jgi:hypothetical protein
MHGKRPEIRRAMRVTFGPRQLVPERRGDNCMEGNVSLESTSIQRNLPKTCLPMWKQRSMGAYILLQSVQGGWYGSQGYG